MAIGEATTLERTLALLGEIQSLMDGDPAAFGDGHSPETLLEVVEAWEAVTACSDMFLAAVRTKCGLPDRVS